MFDPNSINNQQQQQTTQIQYQTEQKQEVKQGQQDGQQKTEFPSFCYANVNMIHKITPNTQTHNTASTVNMAQLTDDKCYITQPQFSYNYALVNQMQLAATQNTISNITFKCDICGLMFGHLSLLNHHKRIHNTSGDQNQNPQQITVQVATGQQTQPQAAQIQIVATERIRFSCDECGMAVSTQAELKTHKNQMHPGSAAKNLKTCDSCGIQVQCDGNTGKGKKKQPFRCENCSGAENLQDNGQQGQTIQVVTAQGTTQPGTIYVVATEGTDNNGAVKFEQVDNQVTQTTQNNAQPTNALGTQNSIPIGVKTAANNTTTTQPGHHPVKRRGIASVTKCNKCNGSGIIFIGGNKRNQDDRDKPFHCNICNGSFSRYSSLWSHKRLHSGEKNFKCNICSLAFAKAAYLKNHSRIHTGEKPYRCNVCGMQFSQSPHLKNHERIHSGERPYICEVCDKSFARHSTLWNHRRIHTGEKPYRCDICGSCFNQATHLKNHAKVHSGEKPFKCDICSVGFSDRFALKRHRNIHEKYGRTKPNSANTNQANVVNNEQQNQQNQQQQQQQQMTTEADMGLQM